MWIEVADRGGELGATRAGVTGEAPSDVLWHYNLSARHLDKLCERVDTFSVSGDGERLVVRHRDDTIVVPSSHKVDDDDPAYIRVDLTRLRRTVNPRAEWRQMFDENGRLMASHYWREDMNGVDWDSVLNRYRPLVDLCHVVDDLHDILWETVAELNTSHSYVSASGAAGDSDMRAGSWEPTSAAGMTGLRSSGLFPASRRILARGHHYGQLESR